jgi:hypothetical protein
MLNRTDAHEDIVEVLLARGRPSEALRYARAHGMATIGSRGAAAGSGGSWPAPSRFLEAAAATGDRALFYAVYSELEARDGGGVKAPMFAGDPQAAKYVDLYNEWFVRGAEAEDELF